MAVNRNPSLKARHTLLVGTTGSGKSQAAKNLIPQKGARVIAFDPDGDHKAHAFATLAGFARELKKADKSGKPYRLSYTGAQSWRDLEQFCRAVWAVLDGRKTTHVILEEAAQFSKGSGPADEALGNLYLRSRKYGGILYGIGQRAAELPSTMRANSPFRYAGLLEGRLDAQSAEKLVDVPAETLMKTEPDALKFWRKVQGYDPEIVQFRYMG